MRNFILSGAALSLLVMPAVAADLAPIFKAPIPVYTWTGCYVGADVGGGWANQGVLNSSQLDFPLLGAQTPANDTATGSTIIGGGHVGCNYQWVPSLVIGVEADFSGTSLDAHGNAQSLFGAGTVGASGGAITWSTKLDSIATVRGRLGYAWTPNTLLYVTSGGAWGRTNFSSTDVFILGCPACATASFSNTSSGVVLGGGVEWAPWSNNWTIRAEYLWYSLGGASGAGFVPGIAAPAANVTWNSLNISSGRAGLSYRF
jgi:outer membrane immunogenic protein